MRVARIERSYVDGPGLRMTLRVQGCSIRCSGCQNRCLWPPSGGVDVGERTLADILANTGLPVTITGGEPFDQPGALAVLLDEIRRRDPDWHVVVYTGRTFEQLVLSHQSAVLEALALIDVLVDGPYVEALDHDGMQYRGSMNQRVIDLQATFRQPAEITLSQGPVLLDWDTPEIVITGDGDALAAADVVREFAGLGVAQETLRCGEVKE